MTLYLTEDFQKGDRSNYFVKKLIDCGLSDETIEQVLLVLDDTCLLCFDAPAGCHCWYNE